MSTVDTDIEEQSAREAEKGQSKTDSEQLAEILSASGIVDRHMLERARAIHQTQGRWLGSILVELGAVGPEEVAQVLANQLSLKTVDLVKIPFNAGALQLLPESMARRFGVVPVSHVDNTLHLAMVNPLDTLATDLIQARTGTHIEPLISTERDVRSAIDRLYGQLARVQRQPAGMEEKKDEKKEGESGQSDEILHVDDLLRVLIESRGSDLHLSVGCSPTMRVDGELSAMNAERLTPTRINELIYAILTDEQIGEFEQKWELDFAYSVRGLSRFRVNVHRQRGTVGAVFRAVPVDPPSLDGLGMPEVLNRLAAKPRGLVLVTGPTGSGKSTTLAAMIREINVTRRRHIVTIEDPIEFLHRNEKSIVIQREVGSDTKSFSIALRHVLRQDPDVILIGEMRDLETIGAAITAAETGHLVLATLHTTSAAQTVDRIVDVFPPHQQEQVRVQLSTVLEGIVCQTLLPLSDGKGRCCAQEILCATSAIRNLIREGKTHQMPSVLQSSASEGMQILDQALKTLVQQGKVVPQAAMAVASNPADFKMFLNMR
ncbi:MAG: PilT/PilU family type 4a pilus ATPase [Armatimonadetes bacterium]|nr:PilT/PilU family type 4a pilus ATPase [Armatimonadota bacterium]